MKLLYSAGKILAFMVVISISFYFLSEATTLGEEVADSPLFKNSLKNTLLQWEHSEKRSLEISEQAKTATFSALQSVSGRVIADETNEGIGGAVIRLMRKKPPAPSTMDYTCDYTCNLTCNYTCSDHTCIACPIPTVDAPTCIHTCRTTCNYTCSDHTCIACPIPTVDAATCVHTCNTTCNYTCGVCQTPTTDYTCGVCTIPTTDYTCMACTFSNNSTSLISESNVIVSGDDIAVVTSDSNGYYVFERISDGEYKITASAIGYKNSQQLTITIPSNESDKVNFFLERSQETQLPNLTPFAPETWDYPIVPSSVPETNSVGNLDGDNNTYIDIAVLNDSDVVIEETFYLYLYLDGKEIGNWKGEGLEPHFYAYVEDWISKVTSGPHTLILYADPTGKVEEFNYMDNLFQRSFIWSGTPSPPCDVDEDDDNYGSGRGCLGPDCDDYDENINPGALEICGDGIDNDCDYYVDDNDPDCYANGDCSLQSIRPLSVSTGFGLLPRFVIVTIESNGGIDFHSQSNIDFGEDNIFVLASRTISTSKIQALLLIWNAPKGTFPVFIDGCGGVSLILK